MNPVLSLPSRFPLASSLLTGLPYFPACIITLLKRERDLYILMLSFQQRQQRFVKYSGSYWVNLRLRGCRGSVDRICFPQQLLSWTQNSLQHLCWAPSDQALWVCEGKTHLFTFIQKTNSFLMMSWWQPLISHEYDFGSVYLAVSITGYICCCYTDSLPLK